MKTKHLFFAVATALLLLSCGETQKMTQTDNSMNSLDWNGIYQGVLPCADCPGIESVLQINQDLTYTLQTKYMDKSDDTYQEKGTFSWNKEGNTITTKPNAGGESRSYQVGENQVKQLDRSGKVITGDLADSYILKKALPNDITEKYWKLIEINGNPVDSSKMMKEAFIILKKENNRVNGNGGCNGFFGTYELKEGNRISFSQMGSTMMACLNMEVESQLLKNLEIVDNYSILNDTLSLNRARMAPLAKFEAVYLR